MTFIDYIESKTKSKIPRNKSERLIVHGQGVYIFTNNDSLQPVSLYFFNKGRTDGLEVVFQVGKISVRKLSNNKYYLDKNNKNGLIDKKGAYYWFSLDSQNRRFYAGFGEARIEDQEYFYQLDSDTRQFLESLVCVDINGGDATPLKILRDPITQSVALKVRDTNELTMDDIASNLYMPTANLTTINQKLYNCISGKKFVLDTIDFPEFTRAIEYSIATPGMWCYNKLREKSTEFNPNDPNLNETYLRITLGQNNGESPGIPYVMEIWPVGHYSPVHNHSGANAIIRVLHGSINVSLYSFLCDEKDGIEPFGNVNFDKEDVTWISANLNQVHKLKNLDTNKDTCITIQCYMYDETDKLHYDYFDYIDDDGKKEQYDPDMDMDFIEFKEQMRMEWNARNKRKLGCCYNV